MVFKRKLYDKMLQWKNNSKGTTALLIEGARRVGKSTIVEQFAKKEYKSYILIDFSNTTDEVRDLFKHLADIDSFFMHLKALFPAITLYKRQSIIVFDEVQQCPQARQAIKHLVLDGRYDYIETGSLISIKQNVKGIVIPSEEESMTLYPMDYEEFLWAIGDNNTYGIIKDAFNAKKSLSDVVNRKLMYDFRLYMLVGGMPQAVEKYIGCKDLCEVDKIKRNIIRLYTNDFHKLDASDKIQSLFLSVPSQLQKSSTKFKKSTVLPTTSASKAAELVDVVKESMTVNVAYNVDDPSVGFGLTSDNSAYKIYVCDTGLFVTLAFWDKDFADNDLYRKLLSDKLNVNLGYLYENVVAQMLKASGNKLYYHTFYDDSRHSYEIDFLISRSNKICPIEVKSSGYKSHTSIDLFCNKYSERVSNRYMLYTKDLHQDGNLLMLPIYMAGLL